MPTTQTIPCAVEGCNRPSAPRSRHCWTHLRRQQEERPLDAPIRAVRQTPLQRVWEAVQVYMECDTGAEGDRSFERARWRLVAALKAYRKAGCAGCPKLARLERKTAALQALRRPRG